MGTYSSFRGVIKIKREYLEIAEKIVKHELSEQDEPFIKEFFKTERSTSIPNSNELQRVFRSEESFFNNRVEKDLLYLRTDLKNYTDHNTGLTPIDSFFKNILENIAEEILLLEVNIEDYTSVNQYTFSKEHKINIVNVTNYDNQDYRSMVPPSEAKENDFFKKFKKANNLQVFKSAD